MTRTSPNRLQVLTLLVLCFLIGFSNLSLAQDSGAPPEDGSVGMIRSIGGVVSLKSAEGKVKFASAETRLFVGDVITTERGSSVVLEFIDSTQVALRASTRFVVENYVYKPEEPVADRAEFKLVKGGLRTLTGLIGKRGTQDAFALKSATATIGIRGTDFAARICAQNDCEKQSKNETVSATENNTGTAGVAGRVTQASGRLRARTEDGKERELSRGAPVFAGDTIISDPEGFAVLAMADATRLTIPADSEMQISAYRYAPASPKTSVASFKLVKGAVRFVTGAIGRAEPDNIKFSTSTATIGIRGTGGDIACVPATSGPDGTLVTVACSGNFKMNVDMRSGQVTITTPEGSLVVNAGQSGFLVAGAQPRISNVPLNTLLNLPNAGPLPETIPFNFEDLSSASSDDIRRQASEGGGKKDSDGADLFVSVNDGEIVVSNEGRPALVVARGQGAYVLTVADTPPILLQAPPEILATDPVLGTADFRPAQCAP